MKKEEQKNREIDSKSEKSIFDSFNLIPFSLVHKHANGILKQREKCLDNLDNYEKYLHNLTKPPKQFSSKIVGDEIEKLWYNEVKQCGIISLNDNDNYNYNEIENENVYRKRKKRPSLFLVLMKTIYPELFRLVLLNFTVRTIGVLSILELINGILESVNEISDIKSNLLFLKQQQQQQVNSLDSNFSLINYNDNNSSLIIDNSIINEENYIDAYNRLIIKVFLLILPIGFQTCVFAYIKLWRNKCGLKCRASLSQLILRKSTKLSLSTTINDSSSSHALNLISNEVTLIEESHNYFAFTIFGPLTLLIGSIWMATRQTGWLPILYSYFIIIIIILILNNQAKKYKKLMLKRKDETKIRINITSNFLNSIKVAKMYSWEIVFRKLINEARERELNWYKKLDQIRVFDSVLAFTMQKQLPTIVFLTYIYINNTITANILYTVVMGFNNFAMDGIFMFMNGKKASIDIRTACKKIENYLLLPEISNEKKDTNNNNESFNQIAKTTKIICKNLTVGYNRKSDKNKINPLNNRENNFAPIYSKNENSFCEIIKNFNIEMNANELIMIIGPVGSGKSTLLMSLLKEIRPLNGRIEIDKLSKISYSSQDPWILSDTIKNNILLGRKFNYERYKKIIKVCSLERDLKLLPNGDETLVGTKGVSLSGGQKARINLARCVYSKSQIYLLDDPLSAVDTKVAKNIFENCIQELLKNKLVLLATHQRQFINKATKVIVLEREQKPIVGTPKELIDLNCPYLLSNDDFNNNNLKEINNDEEIFKQTNESNDNKNLEMLFKSSSSSSSPNHQRFNAATNFLLAGKRKVISPYLLLFKFGSTKLSGLILILTLIIFTPFNGFVDYYLKIWREMINDDLNNKNFTSYELNKKLLLGCLLYGLISIFNGLLSTLYQTRVFNFIRLASTNLHNKLMDSLFKARMSFYDFCSSGTLITRYSGDFTQIDHVMPTIISALTTCSAWLFGFCLMIIFVQPIASILFVILFFVCAPTAIRGYKKSKILIDMSKMLRGPTYTNLSTIIDELVTIRSDKDYLNYTIEKFDSSLDKQISMSMLTINFEARISSLARLPQVLVVTIIFYLKFIFYYNDENSSDMDAATVGVFLILIYNIVGVFPFVIELLGSIESVVASVNSVQKLLDILGEDDCDDKNKLPQITFTNNYNNNNNNTKSDLFNDNKILALLDSAGVMNDNNKNSINKFEYNANENNKLEIIDCDKFVWKEGKVEFKNVSLKYFSDEKKVLKDLSFIINGGERIGVVGRTGAGKSSIVSVLFRLYNFDGSIIIDGINSKNLSLRKLRTSLGVIPQDPVLFCDSLRKNLDPFNEYNDEQLWKALDVVKLKKHVSQNLSSNGLDHHISEGGKNFSTGQRQLVCLARAILKSPKILVMDEATANVDTETDLLIQETIKNHFINSTVITIAHRLNTILDYDKILVLDAGEVVEYDTIENLLIKENGHFKSMLFNSKNEKTN